MIYHLEVSHTLKTNVMLYCRDVDLKALRHEAEYYAVTPLRL